MLITTASSGSKPGGPKSSLRHTADDSKQSSSKSGIAGASSLGPPPSKKPRQAPSSEASGGLFSDPIRVQPSQSSGAKGATSAVIKGAHSSHGSGHATATTPSPSVIEGALSFFPLLPFPPFPLSFIPSLLPPSLPTCTYLPTVLLFFPPFLSLLHTIHSHLFPTPPPSPTRRPSSSNCRSKVKWQ